MRIFLQFLIISCLFVVCNIPAKDIKEATFRPQKVSNELPTNGTFDALIQKLLTADKVKKAKNGSQLIILKNDYCASHDCKTLLNDYKNNVELYTLEELHQRGLKHSIVILDINISKRQLRAALRTETSNSANIPIIIQL